jgi:hypothetical protein
VKVSDRIDATGDAVSGGGKLTRTLTLEGKIPDGALFRVASAAKITPQGDAFLVEGGPVQGLNSDNKFVVSAPGAELDGQNLVLPARADIVVTYSWPGDHSHHNHASAQ